MRTLLAIALGVTIFAGGCVSKPVYDEALAANRRMKEQLERTRADLKAADLDKNSLDGNLKTARDALNDKEKDIRLLTAHNASLADKCTKFEEEIEKLRQQTPQVGPISIVPLPEEIDKALQEFAKANPDLVEYQAEHGMIKLKADLTFAKGSDDVQQSAQQALAKFAEILNSQQAKKFSVFIAGHTDDIPIVKEETLKRHPNNWYLSVHRAVAVLEALTKTGIASERICAMGFGEYHPLEPNKANNQGNKANRRVELWIVPEGRFVTTKAQPGK
ncbi:MAG TPA: OmpA family protein [Phycisphaerae bacterium]|nr:OmpA family protein [Phycisphaerae bacterium]